MKKPLCRYGSGATPLLDHQNDFGSKNCYFDHSQNHFMLQHGVLLVVGRSPTTRRKSDTKCQY